MAGIRILEFTNDDLVDFTVTWVHNLGVSDVALIWVDEAGALRNAPDLFTIVDENTITLNVESEITGEHKILLLYDAITALQGRKLFALPLLDDTIANDYRIALGKDGELTGNMTMAEFYNLIATKTDALTLLKINNDSILQENLREALNVYSKTGTSNLFARKYSSGVVSGALLTDNTLQYTPTSNFNPATKIYTDTGGLRDSGTIDSTGRHASISNLFIYHYERRSGWVHLILLFTSNSGSNTEFRRIGNVSFIPQVTIDGHGFRYRRSDVRETCPYRILSTGHLDVIPNSAGEWLINVTYPIKVD